MLLNNHSADSGGEVVWQVGKVRRRCLSGDCSSHRMTWVPCTSPPAHPESNISIFAFSLGTHRENQPAPITIIMEIAVVSMLSLSFGCLEPSSCILSHEHLIIAAS